MFTQLSNVIKSLFSTATALAPMATLFGSKATPQIAAAVQLTPVILALMDAAETSLGSGTGEQKKTAVNEALKAFSSAMAQVSTGGQKETWTALQTVDTGAMIDLICAIANAVGGCNK